MSTLRRIAGPTTLCVVLLVALVIGSGAFDASPASGPARVAALERDVKCPDCLDLSVAQSNTQPSIALRNEIAASVRDGQTDSQILAAITRRYGNSILLLPPPGGLDSLLWVIPTALAAGAVVLGTRAVVKRRST